MKNPEKRFAQAIEEHNCIMICMKGSPDPDVLASSYAIKILCEKYGKNARIVATKNLSLAQNRLFARRLSLSFEIVENFTKLLDWADSYIVLDHASPVVEGISQELPCIVHIDHHEPVPVSSKISMRWCRTDVGSTSTLVSLILKKSCSELSFSDKEMQRMTTALLFGIQTDTDKYALATKNDYSAIDFLSRYVDGSILKKLSGVQLSKVTARHLRLAERNKKIYKDWLITGVGFVPEKNRDDIAICADFLLRRERVSLVVVFALIHNERKNRLTFDASLRSSNSTLKLNRLIRRIATDGGGRKFKGAFQVKMDFFSNYSDKERLWEFVEYVATEKLKRSRDLSYKDRIQGVFENAADRMSQLIYSARDVLNHTKDSAALVIRRKKREILRADSD